MTIKIRKISNRTGNKQCDICHCPNFLVLHHIEGRNIKNKNGKTNLTDICPNCHFLVHQGEIIIEKWTMTSNGMELVWHYKSDESLTGIESKPYIIPKK